MSKDRWISEMSSRVSWEKGIIGKWEHFFRDRFPIGPMWARALPSSLVSIALSNVVLTDKMGDVKPSLWFMYVGRSGLGYKTPPLKIIRKLIQAFNPELVAPSKFTPEGFTEYVKKGDTVLHFANFIIRDETSKLLGEALKFSHMNTLLEYLSELWDGWIEGYRTRKMQYEGNISVYVTFLSATSEYFFELLTEGFFRQGLGNRILWIIEIPRKPEKLDPESFFFPSGSEDEEYECLKKETLEKLKELSSVTAVYLLPSAQLLWTEFQYELNLQVHKDKALAASFKIKQPLNCLKLAMVYAASISNVDWTNKTLIVDKESMKRAIDDTRTYFKMWQKAIEWWEQVRAQKRDDLKQASSKYELFDFIEVALKNEGFCSIASLSGELFLPGRTKIAEVIGVGVSRGFFEILNEPGSTDNLTAEQIKRFKPTRGPFPQVFKVTKKGKEANDKNKQKH